MSAASDLRAAASSRARRSCIPEPPEEARTGALRRRRGPARALLILLRVSNLPTTWTNVLAGALLCGVSVEPGGVLLLVFSISCFYVGGMALNDLWDRRWDGVHRPERPIPSGQISVAMATGICLALFGAAMTALLAAPSPWGLPAGGLLLVTIMLYDHLHKRSRLGPCLMALCRFLTYPVTALALAGQLPWPVLAGAAAQFAYVLALTLVARSRARSRPPSGAGAGRSVPLVPLLIAGISLVDGLALALLVSPWLLLAGVGGALLTLGAQRFVPGD